MVEVKNLCKKYGDFVALDDLNFDVADGGAGVLCPSYQVNLSNT